MHFSPSKQVDFGANWVEIIACKYIKCVALRLGTSDFLKAAYKTTKVEKQYISTFFACGVVTSFRPCLRYGHHYHNVYGNLKLFDSRYAPSAFIKRIKHSLGSVILSMKCLDSHCTTFDLGPPIRQEPGLAFTWRKNYKFGKMFRVSSRDIFEKPERLNFGEC